jgi:hypothetical protein
MKLGDGSNIPRVTCHGACEEGACVVSEVGDNQVHELLRELGWTCSGRLWGTSAEKRLDFGFGSAAGLVSK